MRLIRGILSGMCFLCFGIGGLSLGSGILPLTAIFVRDRDRRKRISINLIRLSWRFFVWMMSALRLIDVQLVNFERLKALQGCIVAANHPSLIDVVILVSLVENPVCVVKSRLTKNIVMRRIIESLYISNDSPAPDFIAQCKEALDAGFNIIIFPEGTRSTPGVPPRYHRGLAHAAIAANAEILPVHIAQSARILGKEQMFYEMSDERVIYRLSIKHKISPEGKNAREIIEEVKLNIE